MKTRLLPLVLVSSALFATQAALATLATSCTASLSIDASSSGWGDGQYQYCFNVTDNNSNHLGKMNLNVHGMTDTTSLSGLTINNCDKNTYLRIDIYQIPLGTSVTACPGYTPTSSAVFKTVKQVKNRAIADELMQKDKMRTSNRMIAEAVTPASPYQYTDVSKLLYQFFAIGQTSAALGPLGTAVSGSDTYYVYG